MRRSICYCEPAQAYAGEVRTWKFIYAPGSNLPKGARLKFDLQSLGRRIDWEIPVLDPKKGQYGIYAVVGKGKAIIPNEIENPQGLGYQYEFVMPASVPAGEHITIVLGGKSPEEPKNGKKKEAVGIQAQTTVQRRRPFLLHISPNGKGYQEEPEVFNLDVKGGELAQIKIIAPSFVVKNKRFDVTVRFEDEFGNLTRHAPEDTLIELTHEHIRDNLNWKLFIPETGFLSLPNFYFNEAGVYTIRLINTGTKEVFCSAPIRCFTESSRNLYWGMIHGESERFDSTVNIDSCVRHFRDDKALNFFAATPFESQEETPNETWKEISQNVAEFNEDDRFTTFLGMQWVGEPSTEGIRCLLYNKDNKPILRRKDLKSNNLKKIYKSFAPKELISIPCFTMGDGLDYDFSQYDPEYERVVEIYNAWGSSEMTKKEGNKMPIQSEDKDGVQEQPDGAIQRALQNNCRFGFVAGGLDDRGVYADLYDSNQEQYTPGLTAIISPAHSRDGLMEALYQRSCYATTGERIIVGITLAGIPMGREVSTAEKPGLTVVRHFACYVAGTTKLKTVELIRNGKVIHTQKPNDYFIDFTYDDLSPLEKECIRPKDKQPPFVYYYLRVTQEDGHMAWSSPIWVDYIPLSALPKNQNKRAAPKPPPKIVETFDDIDDEDEDEDEDFDYEE